MYIDFLFMVSGKREALENNQEMNIASTSTAVCYGFQETSSWGSLTKDQRQGGHRPSSISIGVCAILPRLYTSTKCLEKVYSTQAQGQF
jgi:hypothetical protein